MTGSRLVLASRSAARRTMLENAGVPFEVDAADVDEAAAKAALGARGASAERVADALAELKARRVCARRPGTLVLGADSMLECGGRRFDKAATVAGARRCLLALRGRTHRLVTAAALLRDGERLWGRVSVARLTMRAFSEAFLDDYLAAEGDLALASVGCYRIEGRGPQLFDRIEGDFFAILGLPMLELLDMLRVRGVLAS